MDKAIRAGWLATRDNPALPRWSLRTVARGKLTKQWTNWIRKLIQWHGLPRLKSRHKPPYICYSRHEGRFPLSRGDDYVFQAGDINGHNIIIATLPAGQEYGTGSAAALASQVKKFFPNLWFGLLVGVAAGLPGLSRKPPLDIRLGDVLVGLPMGETAGLIAYDLGKETGDNGFQMLRLGHALATTETVVRSAISSIKLQAPYDTNVFLPHYERMKHKDHTNGTFIDPGQDQDRLYEVDGDVVERLVERDMRPDSKRSRVWYGPIGSGEKLMKNSRKRDELRDKYNVIGLEMEAAGTMNRIAVGVVRGVCDYGDEHKNKKWQPYAAAMAAAYAKAILHEIRPKSLRANPVPTRDDLRGEPLEGPALCDLPSKTERFFGRESELSEMRHHLKMSGGGRKGLVLYGISGYGKTQLVLEYIEREREVFSAILWIDASSPMSIEQSFASCASRISTEFSPSRDHASQAFVLDWLQKPRHRDWLLVIDSIDDLIRNKSLLDSVRKLGHGALCLTSTHPGTATAAAAKSIHIQHLDAMASQSLILWRALNTDQDHGDDVRESASRVAKVLDGFTLGLELAGILIAEGIVSLNAFPTAFKTKYRQLTQFQVDPGMWLWDKSDTVFGIFDALYQSLYAKNESSALLLTLCSIYGPCEIPSSLLRHLELYVVGSHSDAHNNWRRLEALVRDDVMFNLAIHELYRIFLAKKKQDLDKNLISISLHGSLCRWRFATISDDSKPEWIIQASYGLARHVWSCYDKEPVVVGKSLGTARQFFYPSDRCLDAIQQHVPDHELEPPDGKYAVQYFTICSSMAHIYLEVGKFEISKKLFSRALEYLLITQNDSKSNDRDSFRLIYGFAVSCQPTGDISKADEALQSALEIAQSLYGYMSDEAVELNSQLKTVRDRVTNELDHRKRALISSAEAKRQEPDNLSVSTSLSNHPTMDTGSAQRNDMLRQARQAVSEDDEEMTALLLATGAAVNPQMTSDSGSTQAATVVPSFASLANLFFENGAGFNAKLRKNYGSELTIAASGGKESIVRLLIEDGADIHTKSPMGFTALQCAVRNGHEAIVRLLIEKGADIHTTSLTGYTVLHWAAYNGCEAIARLLIEKGADINGKGLTGRTALYEAVDKEHEEVVRLLVEKGAYVNMEDVDGQTALHWAVDKENETIVGLLTEKGIYINMKDMAA